MRAARPGGPHAVHPALRATVRTAARSAVLACTLSGLLAPTATAQRGAASDAEIAAAAAVVNPLERGLLAEMLDAARGAEAWYGVRARYENRRDARFDRRSIAPTVRTVFGVRTAPFRGLWLGAELENTTVLGSERFFDGLNDRTDRPLVLDPEGTTLNRAFVAFADASGTELRAGRLRHTLFDGRLVGPDPWRQNDQVFDGAVLGFRALDVLAVEYAFLGAVNRPIGDDAPQGRDSMETHVADVTFARGPELGVSAYLVDVDLSGNAGAAPSTIGVRAEGELDLWLRGRGRYLVDVARQRGDDGGGRDVRASYARVALGYEALLGRGWRASVGVGLERLGAGAPGEAPFLTPLASASDFNGWLDRFTTTPDAGLIDRQLVAELTWREVEFHAAWHDFETDRGGADLGSEWNLGLRWRPSASFAIGAAVADGSGAGSGADATSVALWVELEPVPVPGTVPTRW